MKRLIFAASVAILFSTTMPGGAVTDNQDGSVTFTREEAQNLLDNFRRMEADSEQYEKDRAMALRVLQNMQKHINELEARKCT